MYSHMTFLKNSRNLTNKYLQVCSFEYSEAKDYHVRSVIKLYSLWCALYGVWGKYATQTTQCIKIISG